MLRELQNIILLQGWRKPSGRPEWSVGILGGVIALIGIILALGGAQLIGVGGSSYYLFAGLALIVAGLAVTQRKLLGVWIYAGAFVVTALWAFWEVGLNGWALVPRLVGPLAAATDNLIRAIDVETGATLWQDTLPAGGQANPMVYEIGGQQHLVIMAGGHHFMGTPPGDYVIAYTLPQR